MDYHLKLWFIFSVVSLVEPSSNVYVVLVTISTCFSTTRLLATILETSLARSDSKFLKLSFCWGFSCSISTLTTGDTDEIFSKL